MDVGVKRFDVFLIDLDPTVGVEMQKTRPCLVISPDEMNDHIRTVIIAPMTTTSRPYPTRISCRFQEKQGYIVLDQIRTVALQRLQKRLGRIDQQTQYTVLDALAELFAE
ncbi:type II toxin-antitoxin system PemK/MazF family toxin [Candidatus Chloroploca asiatica]|uniref:Transcriptional regulator n=1 Tax=Candidatus Chloroploca asiatica TaxID=1506545 RepID=A0A2H3L942_9CHLR|nr:type II toxin-antitoxin system PemK/MazF family toxin [Candidatus Chloroploca asiatica]PDV98826.1 transcriptional regulator [Candidatus Chloroploca asiatica]